MPSRASSSAKKRQQKQPQLHKAAGLARDNNPSSEPRNRAKSRVAPHQLPHAASHSSLPDNDATTPARPQPLSPSPLASSTSMPLRGNAPSDSSSISPRTDQFSTDQDMDNMATNARNPSLAGHFPLLRHVDAGPAGPSSSAAASRLGHSEANHRRIDVNDAKNTNVHRDSGPLELAWTVLQSCPLQDTLALLIILMQLSPIALTAIYMLFTLLTYVPPVSAPNSGLNVVDIFEGSHGVPSLPTLLALDFCVLLAWLFLSPPAQQFVLDLAQVVIALTLGGTSPSGHGTVGMVGLCVVVVFVMQWTRHVTWCGWGSSLVSAFSLSVRECASPVADDPLGASRERAPAAGKAPYLGLTTILAIHILTQGIVRQIREWYLRRERRHAQFPNQSDAEAGKASSIPSDSNADGTFAATDSEANPTSALTAAGTNKKRRKQCAQVRKRQPLWAALASTKIVMVKEYELSHAASTHAVANAADIHNLGNAPFHAQAGQIWISYVGCDEVSFSTSPFTDTAGGGGDRDDSLAFSEEHADADADDSDGAPAIHPPTVDTTKPFYVRVNHAVWQPTRLEPVDVGVSDDNGPPGTRWTGDIYGLTPLAIYELEFISTWTGRVIFCTSIRTSQATTSSHDVAATPTLTADQFHHPQHSSPIATLKASILAAEQRLADEKVRLKATRKENNRRINAARKEIEKLAAAVQQTGGNDDKLRQKIAQNSTQLKQAEQAMCDLDVELQQHQTLPKELVTQCEEGETAWTMARSQVDAVRVSLVDLQQAIERQVKGLEEEQMSLQTKRNKIAARISKAHSDHARVTKANSDGVDEAQRRHREGLSLEAEFARASRMLNDMLERRRKAADLTRSEIHALHAQLQSLMSPTYDESAALSDAGASNNYHPHNHADPSHTGANDNCYGLVAWAPPAAIYSPSMSASPALAHTSSLSGSQSPHAPTSPPPLPPTAPRARGRSSSMLSDVSGLTQASGFGEGTRDGDAMGATINGHHQRSQTLTQPPSLTSSWYPNWQAGGATASGGGGLVDVYGRRPQQLIHPPHPRRQSSGDSGASVVGLERVSSELRSNYARYGSDANGSPGFLTTPL